VLKDTLGAKHCSTILAIELYFLLRVDLTVFDSIGWLLVSIDLLACGVLILNAHRKGCQHLVIDRQVFRSLMMGDLIVGAFDHLVLVQLPYALKAERVTARQ
jgi:hypothetical protein